MLSSVVFGSQSLGDADLASKMTIS